MPTVAFRTAIRDALDEELAADERVILFGEDIAVAGASATTTGLYDKYGPSASSTRRSPSSRSPARRSARRYGLRPVVEIMFGDFLARTASSTSRQVLVPDAGADQRAARDPLRGRRRGRFGAIHSQMPVSWFMGVPGLKIVAPSTPANAALLKAAIRDDNPVLFFEHKRLYTLEGEVNGAPAGSARRR